ncbi:MAG: hypothetical protein JXJ17_08810 [Anaerolineae bacterium]|nr:hypothetical protein [Anaerolineae bacterium]
MTVQERQKKQYPLRALTLAGAVIALIAALMLWQPLSMVDADSLNFLNPAGWVKFGLASTVLGGLILALINPSKFGDNGYVGWLLLGFTFSFLAITGVCAYMAVFPVGEGYPFSVWLGMAGGAVAFVGVAALAIRNHSKF